MNWLEALFLGIIQGLTEFLPVSSSGHLELGKEILGLDLQNNESMVFTVVVHGATLLSIIIVFYREIFDIGKDVFKFTWNESTQYVVKILVSVIPVAILGLLFEDFIESFFSGRVVLVGSMLIVTAILLAFTFFVKPGERKISFIDSVVIGIAQAFAVLPGISRSGATIATSLLLRDKKEEATKFSFLMVIIPILGANLMIAKDIEFSSGNTVGIFPLIIGFLAAFGSGWLACKWMINIVKKGKLIYFAVYCALVGITAITVELFIR